MPYEHWTNSVRDGKWQVSPSVDGKLQLGILAVQRVDLFVVWRPIGPVEWNLLGTPLHFVLVNARALGGAAEVEARIAALRRETKGVPVQENVRFQGKIFSK